MNVPSHAPSQALHQARAIRQGVRDATTVLDQTQVTGSPPQFTFVPPSHARALDPEATLVEGIRGAGKSFWWAQLASEPHRTFVRQMFPEARLPDSLRVVQGFGAGTATPHWPDRDTLDALVRQHGQRPRAIWRAVIAQQIGLDGEFRTLPDWQSRVTWVQAHPEAFAAGLEAIDQQLHASGQTLLVLFDALDRLADDWQHIQPLARGLLQVALDMRSTRRIRCKVYVRPDLLQDAQITSFPDYSKLLAGRASLEWRRADLYALLYQCLGHTPTGGAVLRTWLAEETGTSPDLLDEGLQTWRVPAPLRSDEALQEQLFERLAGRAMGSSTKRGKPYTWLVNHLQDGLGQVSPRSFFAALHTAATEAPEDHPLALDYRGIQRGVQKASEIRVTEITEDYPWVRLVMEPLRNNLTVPCPVADLDRIWREQHTLVELEQRLQRSSAPVKLPPLNRDQGTRGLVLDLEALGIVQRIDQARLQMPDVFRIAYGLGRRGGVRPLK